MKTKKENYRTSYYEDDVVEYTLSGKVKIPKKYEYCELNGRKYKSFLSPTTAQIALETKLFNKRYYGRIINVEDYGFEIFHCKKCGMYHIITKSVKKKLERKEGNMGLTVLGDPDVEEEKKGGILSKVKKVFSKEESEFTAERAWLETTYGEGCNLSLEQRITNKQREITELIKSKFPSRASNMVVFSKHTSYRCVIDIEEDLAQYKDEILNPFIEKGFKIIDLSEKVDEIEDEHVYLISWKNIFKNHDIYLKNEDKYNGL